ncbi:MAG TPA: carboxypeptidase regulatory-like domain-containing protein [Pyrinomonadaceae bacterium]|jgi:hypothetical protein
MSKRKFAIHSATLAQSFAVLRRFVYAATVLAIFFFHLARHTETHALARSPHGTTATATATTTTTAATQSSTATLSGTVLDEAGAVVASVRITVLNLGTAFQRHATTDEEGSYVIPLLPPGSYHVTAYRDGFTPLEIRHVVLNVNDQLSLRVRLRVGEIGESVTIIEHASGVEESASVSTVVNRQFVENLPLNGRSFQTLFELAPGVILTRTRFDEQGQFSVNGQRANANYFTVDGVSANIGVSAGATPGQAAGGSLPALTTLGGTNNLVSVDALQEFRIQTSTYAPEFGRTPGAQVSIVTRSGTSELRGTLFQFFRHDALDANDFFGNSRGLRQGALRQHDFGGVLGGPLVRERAFFFFSYEGLRLRQPQVAVTEVPASSARAAAPSALRPFLDAFPLPNGADLGNGFAEFAASYSDPSRLDAASLRTDFALAPRVNLFARLNLAPSRTVQRGGVSVTGFSGQSLNTRNTTALDTQTLTAGATLALSPRVTGDLRANWSRTRGATTLSLDDFGGARPPPAAQLFPPTVATDTDAGFQFLLRGGANSNFGLGRIVDNLQRQFNVVGSLSVLRGAHQLKFGVDGRLLLPVYRPLRYAQTVVFGDEHTNGVRSIIDGAGRASRVEVSAEAEPRSALFANLSAFAQNTFRATPQTTFTYGLRWEFNPPPRERRDRHPFTINQLEDPSRIDFAPRGTPLWQTTYANFAPRFGLAHQLSPARGTTLRGGFGIFYDLGTGQAGQVFGSTFPYRKERILSDVAFPLAPVEAAPPPLNLDPPYGTIYAFSPKLQLPRTLQWNISVEQPFGQKQLLTAAYVGAVGRRLLRGAAFLNPNPRFSEIRIVTNSASSDYHALQLQFQRRLSGGFQAHASYAWAHSIDDDSDDSASNFFRDIDPQLERGSSNFDVRHNFNAALTYTLPRTSLPRHPLARAALANWSLDAILRARTATPVNVLLRTGGIIGNLVEAQRPDLIAGVPLYVRDASAPGGRRINREAFALVSGRQGTLGRNALRGFGFSQVDAALRRQFALNERFRLQLRAEFFNLFNHPNFGDPVGDLGQRLFGQSTQMLGRSLGTGGVNGGLSPLYQIGGPRSVQLALKLQF